MRITVVGAVLIVATAIVVALVIRALADSGNDHGETGLGQDQS